MQQESLLKYQQFDFSTNSNWLAYFNNLFPTPSMDMVEKLKKKWYKKNIDPDFPTEFEESKQNNSTNQGQQEIPRNFSQPPQNQGNISLFFKIEGYLKIAFIPGLLLFSGFHLKILIFVICLMAIVRNYGPPKFSKEYMVKVIPSEFTANLLYLLSISLNSSQNGFLFFLPIAIHLSSGIVEFLNRTNPQILVSNPKINEIASMIKNNRNALIITKNKVEFGIFIYLIVVLFLGQSSLFQLIIYLQFLNLKYKFNNNMQTAIWELRRSSEMNPSLPGAVKSVISKFFDLFLKLMNVF